MQNKCKFKKGDFVYSKVWYIFDYEIGKIVRFDNERDMYVVIMYLETIDPESFWRWSYIKEEDLEFGSLIFESETCDFYRNCFTKDVELNDNNYVEFYNKYYFLAKKVYNGLITKEEYYKEIMPLFLEDEKNVFKKTKRQ